MLCFLLSTVVSGFFLFKQKTTYEMRISDWSSDVCSSDLAVQTHKFKCVGLDSMGYMRTRNTPEILGFPRLSADGRGCVEIRKWRRVKIGRASCRERVCQYV